jgi:hypothetical protein
MSARSEEKNIVIKTRLNQLFFSFRIHQHIFAVARAPQTTITIIHRRRRYCIKRQNVSSNVNTPANCMYLLHQDIFLREKN